jgi:serine/threonine protein kinase
MGNAV